MTTRIDDAHLREMKDSGLVATVFHEALRARSEEARLMEEAKAKDERIKALETVLREAGHVVEGIGWHADGCFVRAGAVQCTTTCHQFRSALGLAKVSP